MSTHPGRAQGPLTLSWLGSIVDELGRGLARTCGAHELRITAASALALADHCFDGTPLAMRDFDIVLFADRPVTRDWAAQLGRELSSPTLEFLPHYLWPRDRARSPQAHWRAGWGVLFDAAGLEVDLSIFHDAAAHETNGLLDIHRVRLPLSCQPGAFAERCAQLRRTTPFEALEQGYLEDPHGGYASWRARSARVVGWDAIALEPVQCSIRIVRDFVQKLGRDRLPAPLCAPLRSALARGTQLDTRALDARNLLKVLGDLDAARELALLAELGAFAAWLPSVHAELLTQTPQSLDARFHAHEVDSASPRVETRLFALLSSSAVTARDQEALLEAVATLEGPFVARLRARLDAASRSSREHAGA